MEVIYVLPNLKDMFTSTQKIQKYTSKKSYDDFIDGVNRNLEVIAEGVKNIPLDFRKKSQCRVEENSGIKRYTYPRIFWN